jgi:hypothetical protein
MKRRCIFGRIDHLFSCVQDRILMKTQKEARDERIVTNRALRLFLLIDDVRFIVFCVEFATDRYQSTSVLA